MSFRPNPTGPVVSMGAITVAAAGTPVLLNVNWSPKFDDAAVTAAAPQQYAIVCADIIINPFATNAGGLILKDSDGNTILYVPKDTPAPVHLARSLGSNRFAPHALYLDADQNGDGADVSGIIL